jgi:hypothetical protein
MKFIYKSVSVDSFLFGDGRAYSSYKNAPGKDKSMGIVDSFLGGENLYGDKLSEILSFLLNFYGKDDWEYWQIIELGPRGMKSAGAEALSTLTKGSQIFSNSANERKYPILIFRKKIEDADYESALKQLEEDNFESQNLNIIADFPETFGDLNYKKITVKNIDCMHFYNDTYGFIKDNICYVYDSKFKFELAIDHYKDYGQIYKMGLINKIKAN